MDGKSWENYFRACTPIKTKTLETLRNWLPPDVTVIYAKNRILVKYYNVSSTDRMYSVY